MDLALPPRCPGCGAITHETHRFCADCWGSLHFIAPPWCAGCHMPFAYDRGADALCGACLSDPPRHAGINAAVGYGDVARTVALRLKYGGKAAFAETAARRMARLVPADADLLVPVPLHRWRLWSRGFNQAALIAGQLTRLTRIPNDPFVLTRTRATQVLRAMNPRQRKRAVAGAFAIAANRRESLHGRHIVLIDDVYTSGATTDACTGVLLRAGAANVSIVCWARVLDPALAD